LFLFAIDRELAHKLMRERKEKERIAKKSALSFADDEEGAEDAAASSAPMTDVESGSANASANAGAGATAADTNKSGGSGGAAPPADSTTDPPAKRQKTDAPATPTAKSPAASNSVSAAAAAAATTPTERKGGGGGAGGGGGGGGGGAAAEEDAESPSVKRAMDAVRAAGAAGRKLSKNPFVDTHFLPDREREAAEGALRSKLEGEWKQMQEKVKSELVEITYSYWDGSGHRRTISLPKGTRIDQFLEKARREL
jgi:hypothetical protein